MESVINGSVPFTRKKQKRNSAPWITREIRKRMRKRQRLWKIYRETGLPEHRAAYKSTQKEIQGYCNQARQAFEGRLLDGNGSVKLMFSYMNRRCKKPTDFPVLYDKDGRLVKDDHEKADMLKEFYNEYFTYQPKEIGEIETLPDSPSLIDVEITLEKLKRAIRLLHVSKSNLEIRLNVEFLKELVDVLIEPLTSIFQKSLRNNKIPMDWQKAHMRPIHKG